MSLNRQDILEAVVMAVVTQGGPSIQHVKGRAMACRYRGEKGRRCAIGHLIADEYYSPGFEGEPFCDTHDAIEAVFKTLNVFIDRDDVKFLQDIQESHDEAASADRRGDEFFDRWSEKLEDICDRRSLRFPEELL